MSNHDENNTHDDHNTEGDRQSYKKGWWMSLIGLVIIALGFTVIGTMAFSASGTERWGVTEKCETHGTEDGACCEGEKEGAECKEDKAAGHHDAAMSGHSQDSVAAKSEDHHHDTAATKEPIPAEHK